MEELLSIKIDYQKTIWLKALIGIGYELENGERKINRRVSGGVAFRGMLAEGDTGSEAVSTLTEGDTRDVADHPSLEASYTGSTTFRGVLTEGDTGSEVVCTLTEGDTGDVIFRNMSTEGDTGNVTSWGTLTEGDTSSEVVCTLTDEDTRGVVNNPSLDELKLPIDKNSPSDGSGDGCEEELNMILTPDIEINEDDADCGERNLISDNNDFEQQLNGMSELRVIFDSGYTSHICSDLRFFDSILDEKGFVRLPDKTKVLYQGKGTVGFLKKKAEEEGREADRSLFLFI